MSVADLVVCVCVMWSHPPWPGCVLYGPEHTSVVTYSIIISQILYAFTAWAGFLSTELVGKIKALFKCLK